MSLTKVSYSMISGAPINVCDRGFSTTNTAAQNAAVFNSLLPAGTNGIELHIPQGIYEIDPLVFEDVLYATIRGIGKVVLRFSAGTAGITLGDSAHTKPVRRMIFDNLDISASGALNKAIDMQHAIDCTFYDIKIQDPSTLINTGVYIKWSWDNNFYNLIVKSLNGVVFADQANADTIFGGRFESTNSATGIGILGEAGAGNACIGCDVSSWRYGYSIGGVSGFVIQANYFEANTENDIYFNANAPASGVVIEGNFFDDRTTPINSIKQEGGGSNGSVGVSIRANAFYGPPLNYFIVMNANCDSWSIGANNFLFSANKYFGIETAVNCVIENLTNTWTPVYAAGTSGTPTTSQSSGRWIKQGRIVTAWFQIKGVANGATGTLVIGGLPFTADASLNGRGYAGAISQALSWGTAIPKTVQKGAANLTIDLYDVNGVALTVANMGAGDNEVVGMVTYFAAN